jgi:hypothetical protein
LVHFAFDLLELDGENVVRLPYTGGRQVVGVLPYEFTLISGRCGRSPGGDRRLGAFFGGIGYRPEVSVKGECLIWFEPLEVCETVAMRGSG